MTLPEPAPGFSAESPTPTSQPKIPTTPELFEVFNQVLGKWVGMSAQPAVGMEDEVHHLPLEMGLMFSQPLNGILVIRTAADFGSYLQKTVRKGQTTPGLKEVFMELFILFWHQFVARFWNLDSRKLPASLFKQSIPLDWPNRKSDVLLQVFVEDHPLAIRLWAPITEEEMKRWRDPKR